MTAELSAPRRWDPIVKLTHWGIVVAIILNAIVTEEGSGWHVRVGYGLAALLGLRLLWGIVGPHEARFTAFPPSPFRAIGHIREIGQGQVTHHRSHNPLGALMVYAIWACLAAIIASGIAMAGAPPSDPFAASHEEAEEHAVASPATSDDEDEDEREEEGGAGEEMMEEIHEIGVNLLYVLIALHLMGVVFETRRSGRQIVTAMLPWGNRRSR
ncbi:cytochrome B [Croceicoccus estronivorus]|uniref:cytochrome b/b6 domain-containing protein n=1 Tax=Croceicoccus estronivorus TaxID=1172626 RepID=UPI0008337DE5|nr:cytochrome b/b6 domain-containing protein [Croceicoccus estronivorus]OCC23956.1 cytochrome B [Croceicoccus estronivorus]